MGQIAEAMVLIDATLRLALFGLECALRVEFSVREIERVFQDEREDQQSAKEYTFFDAGGVRVSGSVDEYEPESIWLRIESPQVSQAFLDNLLERARYQALRLGGSRGTP